MSSRAYGPDELRSSFRRAFAGGLVVSLLITSLGCESRLDREPPSLSTYGIDLSSAEIHEFDEWPEIVEVNGPPSFLYAQSVTEPEAPLFRVMDILPRPGGGLYIANSGASEIQALDAEASLEWRTGQRGDGPGEFGALTGLQSWKGDTLVAIDQRHNRGSFFSSAGTLARTVSAAAPMPDPSPNLGFILPGILLGALADGKLVFLGPETVERAGEPGLRRVRSPITVVDPDDGATSSPVEMPGPWMYELQTPGILPVTLTPMATGTPVAVEMDGVVLARDDAYEVAQFDSESVASRVWRVNSALGLITTGMRTAYLDEWVPQFPVEEEIPFGRADVPSFDRVFRSVDGGIWARRYNPLFERGDGVGEEWIRFDSASDSPTVYRFPERVRILAATAEMAFGVMRDSLEVESIVGFSMR